MEMNERVGAQVVTTEPLGAMTPDGDVVLPAGTKANIIGESETHPGNFDLRVEQVVGCVIPFAHPSQFRLANGS